MDQKLKTLALRAKNLGLGSFILMVRNGTAITFHMQEMQMNHAMEMMIAGFQRVIDLELERHPEYSEEFRQLFRDLSADFHNLIKNSNDKFIAFKNKSNIKK